MQLAKKIGGGSTEIGKIEAFMRTTAPDGYLKCDGSTYSITAYPLLSALFLAEFGSYNYFGGDGSTTFAVPDLRGEFLRGTGTNSHSNQGNGASVGAHQDATNTPYMRNLGASNTLIQVRDNGSNFAPTNIDASTSGSYFGNINIDTRNSDSENLPSAYTSRPTNTSVLYCIRAY